jgi:NADH dehydrogenase (ubiquinone) Fe-S protein 1
MIEVTVNGSPVRVAKGSNVLQACEAAGVDIPRFCYHQRLSIAGNCRMCLVEVEKSPKPVASCAMPAAPGMNVKTDTPLVKKAREGVMEFLLINHPLDCPICDQGGECDLQDQAMAFGSDRGRFTEVKRAVSDKNLGPLVKTVMTRCIHCTRCVRFAKEVAGIEDLGVTGRGRDSEIGTYVSKVMTSELSGNVIDLCPVGALTSKPAAFTYRNWELRSTETIDTSDGLGCNVRVDARGLEVMRILPRLNEDINQEWISDKTRFQYDGLRYQRLTVPMVRNPKTGALEQVTWQDALNAAAKALREKKSIRGIAGKLADAESMIAFKDLLNRLGCEDVRHEAVHPASMNADLRSEYLFNSTIRGIDSADAILLIGTNPRVEAPVLNARIRAAMLNGVPIALVGAPVDLTYPYDHLGSDAAALNALINASSSKQSSKPNWVSKLKSASKPMIIVGAGVYRRPDAPAVRALIQTLINKTGVVRPEEDWNGFNVLQDTASATAALDLGIGNGIPSFSQEAEADLVYLLGADDYEEDAVPPSAFVIYQGHHGDRGAARADVILPGAAYTEKWATYVNTEGRPQTTRSAVAPVGEARDDWKIVRALSEVAGVPLPYDDFNQVRQRLTDVAPHLGRFGQVESSLPQMTTQKTEASQLIPSMELTSSITQFYFTDVISRASKTMARCVKAKSEGDSSAPDEAAAAGM